MRRREFLKRFTLLTSAASVPTFLLRSLLQARTTGILPPGDTSQRILCVIEFNGGNDGLNTVVPYRNDFYYSSRPVLAVPPEMVIQLDDEYGFHPVMTGFQELWDEGRVAIVHGIGYPNPTRSHFQAQDIWYRAEPNLTVADGWLAKYINQLEDRHVLQGISIGGHLSKALISNQSSSPAIRSIENFRLKIDSQSVSDARPRNSTFEQLQALAGENPLEAFAARTALEATISSADLIEGQAGYEPIAEFPNTLLGRDLRTVARVIAADLGVQVFYVTMPGFDTHAIQAEEGAPTQGRHPGLMSDASRSISAFLQEMDRLNRRRDVLILTVTEFGRRLPENGSRGTDHGTANTLFFLGDPVVGGFHGEHPSLSPDDLDPVGDMVFNQDFRRAYATALQWLGADPGPLIGESFPPLDVLAADTL